MAKLEWNENIQNAYTSGVHSVILFEPGGRAHSWSGVKRISESVSERTSTPYYVDGFKYHNQVSPLIKTFTMEVFTYPDVLENYLGISNLNGLIVEGQIEKRFHLVYFTDNYDKNGNISGSNVNIIYNVMAIPEDTSHNTLEKSSSAPTMTFKLDAIPIIMDGMLPSYKLTVSQLDSSKNRWNSVIESLFGTNKTNSYLPSPVKLKQWFVGGNFNVELATKYGYNTVLVNSEGGQVTGSPLDGYYKPTSELNATKAVGYYQF